MEQRNSPYTLLKMTFGGKFELVTTSSLLSDVMTHKSMHDTISYVHTGKNDIYTYLLKVKEISKVGGVVFEMKGRSVIKENPVSWIGMSHSFTRLHYSAAAHSGGSPW